jgi:polyisoprenoid-binding protein YceI
MAIYYLLAAGLAGVWLAGYLKKNKTFGTGGSFRRSSLLIPTMASVAAIFLASCAAAPAAVSTPAALAPTVAAAISSNTSTLMPTVAPTADSSGSTPAAVSTTNSPSSGSGSGSTVYTIVPGKSTAQYSVREQLARLNFPSDAVGKTQQVSGSIAVNPDGSIDQTTSKIVVDLSTLQTDSNMRDNFVRRNVLNTNQYPNAVFVPTQVTGLPSPLPTSGPVSFQLTGNLTIQNVTKPVTWDVTGNIQGDQATGTATTSFTFEDFNLTQPKVPVVLSVVDKINLQLDITLQRSGG